MSISTHPKSTVSRWSSRLAVLALAAGILSGGAAQARTDVCYLGGINLPNFKLNGTAKLNGTDLLVTPDLQNQLGSAMFVPTFAATSDIHIQLKLQITTTTGGGADGMAFVMHRDPRGAAALGDPGGAIGYGGVAKITPSIVVEMDTFQNVGEVNSNHIGVMVNGVENVHTALYTPPFTMKTVGTPFYVWIDYTSATKLIEVFISQNATKPATSQLATNVDAQLILGNQPFYMGFTGSTGGSQSQHEILSFVASDTAASTAVCCNTNADCAGNALGTICDPVKHVCGQCTPTQLGNCTMQKAGCDVGSASNTCVAGCTGNFGSGATGACPSASAPFCITQGPTAGSCTACDGNAGSGSMFACPAGAPSCNASGFCGLCTTNADCTATCTVATKICAPCNGDQGSSATNACPDAASPLCDSRGGCRKCTADSDCTTGTHAGPFCNKVSGVCGAGCTSDAQCGSGQWCSGSSSATGSCQSILMSGQPLPTEAPCTPDVAMRACSSKICSATNNQCVECAQDSDCTTSGQVCTNFACTTGMPGGGGPTQFSFAGGGFSCNVSTSATGNAGALALAASLMLLGALTARRRRHGRS